MLTRLLGVLHLLWTLTTTAGSPVPQEGEEPFLGCRIQPLQDNITVQVGSSLLVQCPLDLASACMIDTITWQRAHHQDSERLTAISDSSYDPLSFYIQAAMPEESGWYFCLATSGSQLLESGLYVDVVNSSPVSAHPPTHRLEGAKTTEAPPTPSTPPAVYEDRFRIYKTLEGLSQYENIPKKKDTKELIQEALGPVYRQLSDLYARIGALEEKTKHL